MERSVEDPPSGPVTPPPGGCTPSNNCASNTCIGQQCWNGCNNVEGAKNCGGGPTNGACGTAHGQVMPTQRGPEVDGFTLCSSGTASGHAGTEPGGNPFALFTGGEWSGWDWDCSGGSGSYCIACRAGFTFSGNSCVRGTPPPPPVQNGSVAFLAESPQGRPTRGYSITIPAYSSANLVWTSTNVSGCYAIDGMGYASWTSGGLAQNRAGVPTGNLAPGTYTYGIRCAQSNGAGFIMSSVQIIAETPKCSGSVPPSAVSFEGDNTGLSGPLSWQYSETNTPRKCEFHCGVGEWNGSRCEVCTCTGVENHCPNEKWTDTCGRANACFGGTKECADNWTEVAP